MREPEEITGVEDTIDSRDLLRRCEFLEAHYDDLKRAVADAEEELGEAKTKKAKAAAQKSLDEAKAELNAWDGGVSQEGEEYDAPDAEYSEMIALREAVDEIGEQTCRYGETLISEDHFIEYAEQLAEDICEMPRDVRWPFTCIDWEKAADELRADYSTVTLFGNDYLYRNC